MKSIMIIISIISVVGCSHREKILDATWVSMKYADAPSESNVVRVAPVETTYCMNSWSGSFGLIDEAIKQAEAKFQIDYIKNASFYRDQSCMSVSGEGYRRTNH